MCLIAVAKKGQDKYSQFFLEAVETASLTNTDGIGYAFRRASTGRSYLEKGFETYEDFLESYQSKKLKDADEVIVHLRIGNKGSKTPMMNHPFIVSEDSDEVTKLKGYTTKAILAHNGTFHSYSRANSLFSDTFYFVRDFMSYSHIMNFLIDDEEGFLDVFKYTIGTNKLAIIPEDGKELITLGDFIVDQGYLFSNKSYEDFLHRNVGGVTERVTGSACDLPRQHNPHHQGTINTCSVPSRPAGTLGSFNNLTISKYNSLSKRFPKEIWDRKRSVFIQNYLDTVFLPLNTNNIASVKFTVFDWNKHHFMFRSHTFSHLLSNTIDEDYIITKFDNEHNLHEVSRIVLKKDGSYTLGGAIYLSTKDLFSYFDQLIVDEYKEAYIDIFKFMSSNNIIHSHNFAKRIKKKADGAINNGKTSINYKGFNNFSIKGMKLYYNYAMCYSYQHHISKNFITTKLYSLPIKVKVQGLQLSLVN